METSVDQEFKNNGGGYFLERQCDTLCKDDQSSRNLVPDSNVSAGLPQLSPWQRDPLYDLLKAFAIFLVILQHMIFNCGEGYHMTDTLVGKAITMINMPLFMFITGFFLSLLLNVVLLI